MTTPERWPIGRSSCRRKTWLTAFTLPYAIAESMRAEARRLLEEVIKNYGDVRYVTRRFRELEELLRQPSPSWNGQPLKPEDRKRVEAILARKQTLADVARAKLDELENLQAGKPAPAIDGTGMDGKPLKLSDYRGKVVVLVFWGTWCGPCMQQVPHEREMGQGGTRTGHSRSWASTAMLTRVPCAQVDEERRDHLAQLERTASPARDRSSTAITSRDSPQSSFWMSMAPSEKAAQTSTRPSTSCWWNWRRRKRPRLIEPWPPPNHAVAVSGDDASALESSRSRRRRVMICAEMVIATK